MLVQNSSSAKKTQTAAPAAKLAAEKPKAASTAAPAAKPKSSAPADSYKQSQPAAAAKPATTDKQMALKEQIRANKSQPGAALAAPAQPASQYVRSTDSLNVRSSPEQGATNKIGTFDKGARLEVTPDASGKTSNGDWLHVKGQLPGGKTTTGWVHSAWTKPEAPAPTTGPTQGPSAPPAGAGPTGERPTTKTELNVRSSPDMSSGQNKLGTFAAGTPLEVVPDSSGKTKNGDWTHVQGKLPSGQDAKGWVKSEYLDPEKVRTTDTLNVRSSPTQGNNKIGSFAPNTRLEVTPDASGKAREGDWVHVKSEQNGKAVEGWVHKDYVVSSQVGGTSGPGGVATGNISGKARAAIEFAEAQMDPKTGTAVNRNNGLSVSQDPKAWNSWCLAFVSTAYGRSVPELAAADAISSYGKFNNAGKMVPSRELPPGAPVFFEATKHNSGYGHIAVATGRTDKNGEPTIYTTGWRNYDGIHEVSLSWMEKMTGAYLGYGQVDS